MSIVVLAGLLSAAIIMTANIMVAQRTERVEVLVPARIKKPSRR